MGLPKLLVSLDRGTRSLDRFGLGSVRTLSRRLLGATVARELRAVLDGMELRGTIQHRSYLWRLERGEVEAFTTRLLTDAIRPGTIFVDVGAFLGFYSLRAALAGASVVALEPNPATRRLLEANVARNGAQNRIRVLPFAAADRRGTLDFLFGAGDQSSAGLSESAGNRRRIRVEARRLDELVERADVIKIDVEGAEVKALAGMAGFLDGGLPLTLVVECNPAGLARLGSTPAELVARLERLGFEVHAIDDAAGMLVPPDALLGRTAGFVNLYARR